MLKAHPRCTFCCLIALLQKLTEDEMVLIEKSGRDADCLAGEFDTDLLHDMYATGLVYFDVPVYPTDRFRGMFGGDVSKPACVRTVQA